MLKTSYPFALNTLINYGTTVSLSFHGNLTRGVYIRYKSTGMRDLYDVLGVSSSATQKEIKSAFYRLSMKHHPDRNVHKADAAENFRELTNAYQILSNSESRKEYDAANHAKPFKMTRQASSESYRSSTLYKSWARPPPPTGRSKEFNFDEFYRQHYGEAFKESKIQKQRIVADSNFEKTKINMLKQFILSIIVAMILLHRHAGNVGREPPTSV